MNGEIRRRQRVIRIFPNEDSTYRLMCALLADQHDEWISGVRYFEMYDYWDWKSEGQKTMPENGKIIALS